MRYSCVLGFCLMQSHSRVLGACLVCLMGQLHAVPLLCPGFLSGLSFGSHSCVLGSCLVSLMGGKISYCYIRVFSVFVWFVGKSYFFPFRTVKYQCLGNTS